jgi:hypothetical protein
MRGQSHVVGFALVLGFGVIALGTLTVGIGAMMESQSSHADTTRVATQLSETLGVVDQTGVQTQRVSFADGRLSTTARTLRVLDGGTVTQEHEVNGLVFESGQRRVVGVAGAVVHEAGSSAWLESGPPITSSETNDVLVVGVPVLGAADVAVSGSGGATLTLQSNVSHERTALGEGEFAVAIETTTPEPLERYFQAQNASTTRQTFDDDSHESVVATFPGQRTAYLVLHRLDLEVSG